MAKKKMDLPHDSIANLFTENVIVKSRLPRKLLNWEILWILRMSITFIDSLHQIIHKDVQRCVEPLLMYLLIFMTCYVS